MKERTERVDLILKVEYDSDEEFRADYLTNLSEGGVRLHTQVPLREGQRMLLRLSFPALLAPVSVLGEVRWRQNTANGIQAGVAFVDVTIETKVRLRALVRSMDRPSARPPNSGQTVALVENDPVLRRVYGRELADWAELQDFSASIVTFGSLEEWLAGLASARPHASIIDLDGFQSELTTAESLLQDAASSGATLILLSSTHVAKPSVQSSSTLHLDKPLKFGALLSTIRALRNLES